MDTLGSNYIEYIEQLQMNINASITLLPTLIFSMSLSPLFVKVSSTEVIFGEKMDTVLVNLYVALSP